MEEDRPSGHVNYSKIPDILHLTFIADFMPYNERKQQTYEDMCRESMIDAVVKWEDHILSGAIKYIQLSVLTIEKSPADLLTFEKYAMELCMLTLCDYEMVCISFNLNPSDSEVYTKKMLQFIARRFCSLRVLVISTIGHEIKDRVHHNFTSGLAKAKCFNMNHYEQNTPEVVLLIVRMSNAKTTNDDKIFNLNKFDEDEKAHNAVLYDMFITVVMCLQLRLGLNKDVISVIMTYVCQDFDVFIKRLDEAS